jgi:RNase P subunit RPR2
MVLLRWFGQSGSVGRRTGCDLGSGFLRLNCKTANQFLVNYLSKTIRMDNNRSLNINNYSKFE